MANRKANGCPYTPDEINDVWYKGTYDSGYGAMERRIDSYGIIIQRNRYGDTTSLYGWEIDHIIPLAEGGKDDITNLQPLQWINNRKKARIYPWRKCE
ncbi:MAG: HNH endonuclease signature motif containing protein [Candidatus Cloacimonetes bacterium]|nr:HNH endonuclease signature motif containing protein [Candidatus Cloacimonadota bacterium]